MAAEFVAADLAAINRAIRTGARSCRFEDREVRFHTLAEMLQIRDLIRRDLGLTSTAGNRTFLSHSKGTTSGEGTRSSLRGCW